MPRVLALSGRTADRVVLFLGDDGEHVALATLETVYRLTDRPLTVPDDCQDSGLFNACTDAVPKVNETIHPVENR